MSIATAAEARPSSFTKEDLLACARGDMFGPGNAQLPAPPMLMFDRIMQITADGGAYNKGFIEAELDITDDLWFFACHFIGDPVMPAAWGWTPCGSWSASSSDGRAPPAAAARSASAR